MDYVNTNFENSDNSEHTYVNIHGSLDTENSDLQNADLLLGRLPDPPSSSDEESELVLDHPACQFQTDKPWLDCQYHDINQTSIKKPDEVENELEDPPNDYDKEILNKIHGSMIGMAIGDALGAHVEFRPREYLLSNPVEDFEGGGTWGLDKGQFTDDTSMALCLANSLIARRDFVPYDQLVRYNWWYMKGYMSSTGQCFDIGAATSQSLREFARRQKVFAEDNHIPLSQLDFLSDIDLLNQFDAFCSEDGVAGNGALMRLTPVPLFFYKNPIEAVEFSGISGQITHGDQKAYDACRYYGALIVAALQGEKKSQLLDKNFYSNHQKWFNNKPLHPDIMEIAEGSYQKEGGYDEGIRGKGYIVKALEAALWAFWSDKDSFRTGALAAVNLGDDTDTTAAIYGQLAGAYYGSNNLPSEWSEQVYAKKFIETLSKWIAYEGQIRQSEKSSSPPTPLTPKLPEYPRTISSSSEKPTTYSHTLDEVPDFSSTSSLESDKMFTNKSSYKFESYQDNQNPSIISINRQSMTTSKTTELPSNTTGLNTGGTNAVNISYSSQTNTNRGSTNKQFNLDKNLLAWTINDVCYWVQSFGENYTTYVESFRKDTIDGFRLYNFVNNDRLIYYGVKNEDHRQTILGGIEQLRRNFRRANFRN